MMVTRKITTAVIRRKKSFLLLFVTGCVFHLLRRGSQDLDEKVEIEESLGNKNQKDDASSTENMLNEKTNEKIDEDYKKVEQKESESYADDEGGEIVEKEAGAGGESPEDERDKEAAIGGSFDKENQDRTKIEDKARDVERNRSVTLLLKHFDSERVDAKKSRINGSVFHVDQSNKYPSHEDDRIAYQVHQKISYFWPPILYSGREEAFQDNGEPDNQCCEIEQICLGRTRVHPG